MAHWWTRILGLLLVAWGLLLITRCHLPRQATDPSPDSTSAIYVVRHGWHAGVALRRSDVPDAWGSALRDFPQAHLLEVGWGEVRYYPGHTRGLWGAMRAGLWPTGSVLHVVPVPDSVRGTFPQNTIVRIPVGPSELEALGRFIATSFADGMGTSEPGFYPGSRFYPSHLSYHAFNNCNHWAAAALEAAGCDTSPRWTFTVGRVIQQAEDCGRLIQRGPDD